MWRRSTTTCVWGSISKTKRIWRLLQYKFMVEDITCLCENIGLFKIGINYLNLLSTSHIKLTLVRKTWLTFWHPLYVAQSTIFKIFFKKNPQPPLNLLKSQFVFYFSLFITCDSISFLSFNVNCWYILSFESCIQHQRNASRIWITHPSSLTYTYSSVLVHFASFGPLHPKSNCCTLSIIQKENMGWLFNFLIFILLPART